MLIYETGAKQGILMHFLSSIIETTQFFGPILLDQNQRRQYALNLFNTLLTPISSIDVVINVIALLSEVPIQHIQRPEMRLFLTPQKWFELKCSIAELLPLSSAIGNSCSSQPTDCGHHFGSVGWRWSKRWRLRVGSKLRPNWPMGKRIASASTFESSKWCFAQRTVNGNKFQAEIWIWTYNIDIVRITI